MGLPLYRAPVESDIKAKVPKDPPTRARSTIRRSRHNTTDPSSRPASTSVQYYSRRIGLGTRARARIISPPTAESPWTPWDNMEPGEADVASRSATRDPGPSMPPLISHDNTTQDGSARREPILREVITRNGPMSQDVVRYFGEHMARLYAGTSSRGTQGSEATPEADGRGRASSSPNHEPTSLERAEPSSQRPATLAREPTTRLGGDMGVSVGMLSEQQRRQNERLISLRRTLRAQEFAAMRQAHGARRDLHEARARAPTSSGDTATRTPRFDGLGDRDRSLSPEEDGVWDTLLSSITPDPQPPSVGTSFASTPAPASAAGTSRGTAPATSASTSRTSLAAGPDGGYTPQEIGLTEVCDSGGDNTDTEGDEDEEAGNNALRRFGESYADLTGRDDNDDDDNDLVVFGGVESMQRIVRNLARRQDIPDEWWAEAGLSRTLGG